MEKIFGMQIMVIIIIMNEIIIIIMNIVISVVTIEFRTRITRNILRRSNKLR